MPAVRVAPIFRCSGDTRKKSPAWRRGGADVAIGCSKKGPAWGWNGVARPRFGASHKLTNYGLRTVNGRLPRLGRGAIQTPDRGPIHPVGPCDIGLRLAVAQPLNGFVGQSYINAEHYWAPAAARGRQIARCPSRNARQQRREHSEDGHTSASASLSACSEMVRTCSGTLPIASGSSAPFQALAHGFLLAFIGQAAAVPTREQFSSTE
jgi:hypothetical protein